jgi:hypothetical protein
MSDEGGHPMSDEGGHPMSDEGGNRTPSVTPSERPSVVRNQRNHHRLAHAQPLGSAARLDLDHLAPSPLEPCQRSETDTKWL